LYQRLPILFSFVAESKLFLQPPSCFSVDRFAMDRPVKGGATCWRRYRAYNCDFGRAVLLHFGRRPMGFFGPDDSSRRL